MIKEILKESSRWYDGIELADNYDSRYVSKIKDDNFVVIGMRRLGKTELLKQIAIKYKKEEVLFIDMDNTLFNNINFKKRDGRRYELVMSINKIIEDNKIKLVLFDELQSFKGWSRFLKGNIDKFANTRFIATGSDANALRESSEFGIGRFKIYFIGIYSIEEYLETKKDDTGYIDNNSFPQGEDKQLTLSDKYSAVIEKQIAISNISKLNIDNVLRAIALNPGHKMTLSKLSTTIKLLSDSKVSSEQVEAALTFLINSEIVISLLDQPTSIRTSKFNEYTLYPTDWNSYKYYTSHDYGSLSGKTIPRKGFVFENMIISNIFSKLNTDFKRSKIFNKTSEPDLDVIIKDANYEIKSFDFKHADIKEQIKIMNKAKQLNSSIVHIGKTCKDDGVNFINWIDFIRSL